MVKLTLLGYAILGLLRDEPRSGYALRMAFETTPMGNYSSSPGSIYPALKGLQKAGLVEARAAGRGSLFHVTSQGGAAFEAWLRQPVDGEAVGKHFADVMLRFAFLHNHPDRRLTLDLLVAVEAAAQAQAQNLEGFLASEPGLAMPLQARLAVLQGAMSVASTRRWAAEARHQLMAEADHSQKEAYKRGDKGL